MLLALALLLAVVQARLASPPQRVLSTEDRRVITDIAKRTISRAVGVTPQDWAPAQVVHRSAVDSRGNRWAFIRGIFDTQAAGTTRKYQSFFDFPKARAAGDFPLDNNFAILLRQQGKGWIKVTVGWGCTDVCWTMWPEEWNAPASLFRL